jgi:hypothetical protein
LNQNRISGFLFDAPSIADKSAICVNVIATRTEVHTSLENALKRLRDTTIRCRFNPSITLSIIDGYASARAAFRAFLVHPACASPACHTGVAILPR